MALLWNSSIYEWLQFDGVDLVVPSCQYVNYTGRLEYFEDGGSVISSLPVMSNASCAQVCNDSASVFASQTNNLVACRLWSTLLSAYTVYDDEDSLLLNQYNGSIGLFDQFRDVGLGPGVLEYASAYVNTISACFQLLYYNAKFFTCVLSLSK